MVDGLFVYADFQVGEGKELEVEFWMYSIVGSPSTAVKILFKMCSSESEKVSTITFPILHHLFL